MDEYGFSLNSPLCAQNRPSTPGMQFDAQHPMQKTKIRYSKLIGTTSVTTATTAMNPGDTVILKSTITQIPTTNINFAIPFVAIYQQLSITAANQIYPTVGGSANAASWLITSGFDYQNWNSPTASAPYPTVHMVSIYNNSGSIINITAKTQWKYTANNTAGL